MKKKNLPYLLFLIAAFNLVIVLILTLGFSLLYKAVGRTPSGFFLPITVITSFFPIVILVIAGIILLIKSRKGEA